MSIRSLFRRLDTIQTGEHNGVVVWVTYDGDICTNEAGQEFNYDELPDNGALNVVVRRFGEPPGSDPDDDRGPGHVEH